MRDRPRRRTTALRTAALIVVLTGVCLALIEGLSSFVLALFDGLRTPPAEASRYDETLGWVGIPNADLPDMYGPGEYLRHDSRGFRSDREIGARVPADKLRVICAGDSFTYGQGVANDRTWCSLLSELDDLLETVNIGFPGYGVDQIYLRYTREAVELDHSILVFAFVHGDLDRMARGWQSNYGKPLLRLENGKLVTDNVPVPRLRWSISRAIERAELRSVELALRTVRRLTGRKPWPPAMIEQVGPVAFEVFRSILELTERDEVIPIFVYLPTERDIQNVSAWRGWLAERMEALGATFVDLTPELRAVSAEQAGSFFLKKPNRAAGHYSQEGNAWAARVIYERLTAVQRVRERSP